MPVSSASHHGAQDARSDERDAEDLRKQCIQTVIQALQCFKEHLTPLDVVVEVLSNEEHERAKNDMLKPGDIARLLETLASCEASHGAMQRFIEEQALSVALKRAETETENVVAQIGDQFRHPILLGHAVIRSEPTAAPFLKAILDQVNETATLGQKATQASVEEINQDRDPEATADSDISIEDTVEIMLFNRDESGTDASAPTETDLGAQEDCVQNSFHTDTNPVEPAGLSQHAARLIGIADLQDSSTLSTPITSSVPHRKTKGDPSTGVEYDSPSSVSSSSVGPTITDAGINESSDKQAAVSTHVTSIETGSAQAPYNPMISQPEASTNHGSEASTERDSLRRQKRVTERALALKQSIRGRRGPHECQLCEKKFMQKQSLQDHMNTHLGKTPYICTWTGCHQQFTHYTKLRYHQQTYHKSPVLRISGTKKQVTPGSHGNSISVRNAFNFSGAAFGSSPLNSSSSRAVTQERNPAHEARLPYSGISNSTGRVPMGAARKLKRLAEGGTAPESKKARNLSCDICSKTFTSPQNQKDHMNMHAGLRPYKCTHPGCDRQFTHLPNFYAHCKTLHSN